MGEFGSGNDGFSTEGEFGFGGDGGQSFESKISTPFNKPPQLPAPDAITVRENPFDIFRDRRDQALERLRNPPGFENTAIFTWGEGLQNLPLNGEDTDGNNFLTGTGFKTVDDKNKKNPASPNKNGVKEWSETRRVEKVIKVASEEDPDTYIKVKVALASIIQTDDGVVIVKWVEPTSAPGAGASTNDEEEEA